MANLEVLETKLDILIDDFQAHKSGTIKIVALIILPTLAFFAVTALQHAQAIATLIERTAATP